MRPEKREDDAECLALRDEMYRLIDGKRVQIALPAVVTVLTTIAADTAPNTLVIDALVAMLHDDILKAWQRRRGNE